MSATLRAGVSLFALIGFFVFALALATGLIALGFFVVDFARNFGVWIIVAGAIAALGVRGCRRACRGTDGDP